MAIRYRLTGQQDCIEEPDAEEQRPCANKLKKRLPSANYSKQPPVVTKKNNLFLRQTSQQVQHNSESSDLARLLPKNIYQDKEFLYSELLQIKQQYNAAAEEITRLKTKVATLEKQKVRLIKASEEPEPRSTNLRLKMTVGELLGQKRQPIKNIRLENEKLKRTIKYTQIQQLQKENKSNYNIYSALYEQLERLKQLLQKQLSSNMTDMIYRNLEKKLAKESDDNIKLRGELNKFIEPAAYLKHQKKPSNYNITQEIEKIYNNEIKKLRQQIEQLKQNNLYQRNVKLQEQIVKLERQLTVEKTVVKGLTQKLSLHQLKDKLSTNVSLNTLSSQPTQLNPTRSVSELFIPEKILNQKHSKRELFQQKGLRMGEFLSYKFNAQRYSRCDVEKAIDKVAKYTLHSLNNILLGEPFFMNNEEQRHLFVDMVTDWNSRDPTKEIINRTIDEIVPLYELTAQQDEQQLYVGCSEVITLNYPRLQAETKQHEHSAGTLSKQALEGILTRINMSPEQARFVIGEISFFSDDLDNLNCYAMFDKFYIPSENLELDKGLAEQFEHSYIEEVEEQFEESTPNNEYI